MKLNTVNRKPAMAQPHNLAVGGFGENFQFRWERLPANNQRMIPRRFERVWQPVEDAITLVKDRRGLPVHQSGGPHDLTAIDMTDALVPKADSQDWNSRPELPDEFVADPRI